MFSSLFWLLIYLDIISCKRLQIIFSIHRNNLKVYPFFSLRPRSRSGEPSRMGFASVLLLFYMLDLSVKKSKRTSECLLILRSEKAKHELHFHEPLLNRTVDNT